MTRPRRPISPEGLLTCTKCKELKHISEFYQTKEAYVSVKDTDGVDCWYGKPNSWCKSCMNQTNKEHAQRRRAEVREARLNEQLEYDQELAHVKDELAKQGFEVAGINPDGSLWVIPKQG